MGLVETWLSGIGLNYAMPNFEAAGIVTPKALAELDVSYFEALGIQDPEDRRKLFFLVQRIKLAVKDDNKSAEKEVDAVIARSMRTAPLNDETRTARTPPPTSPLRKKSTKENSPGNKKITAARDKAPPEYDEVEPDNDFPDDYEDFEDDDEDDQGGDSDSEWEQESEGGDSADDEATSTSNAHEQANSRRTSNRFQKEQPNASDKIEALKAKKNNLARSQLQRTQSGRLSKVTGKSTGSRLPPKSDSSSDTGSLNGRRLSGLVAPKARRDIQSKKPKSMRTGKNLSAITAGKAAPMSPLVDLSETKMRESSGSVDSFSRFMESLSDNEAKALSPEQDLRQSKSEDLRDGRRSSTYGRPRPSLSKSNSSSRGSVSYHGTKIDNSFKAQIGQLREENDSSYGNNGDFEGGNDDEMRIRVVVRKRPMSKSEIASSGDVDIIHPIDQGDHGKILFYQPKTRVDLTKEIETIPFAFDNVFGESSTNLDIYERCIRDLIPCLFDGQMVSIFGYGQTASGKTFTMMGSSMTGQKEGTNTNDPSNLGLYYMAALDIFEALKMKGYTKYQIGVSFFEIYGGKLYDLLSGRNHVKCLEDSRGKVCFPGLSEHVVSDPGSLMEQIEAGSSNRSTGTTSRNADSSRSHAVLQLYVRDTANKDKEFSRLTMIDLAGSERGADTSNSSRATRLEGAEINTSLLALKEVIRALAVGNTMTHVPFRGSKLTQVLKDSFVGANCRSVMIACISPNIGNCEQTLNTLRYADRVKERNAITGECSSAFLPKTSGSIEQLSKSQRGTRSFERTPSEGSVQSEASSDVLEELLGSPSPSTSHRTSTASSDQDAYSEEAETSSPSSKVASDLIRLHKDVMSSMLDMVKDEMTLVNETDGDREGLDEYISLLAELQGRQLDYFSALRERIRAYKATKTLSADVNRLLEGDSICEDLRE